MDFGVNLMTRGITGDADGLLAMASAAEAAGFGHVTVNDHIVVPNRIASRYPYTPTGEWPGARAGACLEQLTALGQRIRMLKEAAGDRADLAEKIAALEQVAQQLDRDVDHLVWELRPTKSFTDVFVGSVTIGNLAPEIF